MDATTRAAPRANRGNSCDDPGSNGKGSNDGRGPEPRDHGWSRSNRRIGRPIRDSGGELGELTGIAALAPDEVGAVGRLVDGAAAVEARLARRLTPEVTEPGDSRTDQGRRRGECRDETEEVAGPTHTESVTGRGRRGQPHARATSRCDRAGHRRAEGMESGTRSRDAGGMRRKLATLAVALAVLAGGCSLTSTWSTARSCV